MLDLDNECLMLNNWGDSVPIKHEKIVNIDTHFKRNIYADNTWFGKVIYQNEAGEKVRSVLKINLSDFSFDFICNFE